MMFGRIGQLVEEDFTVTDDDNNLITGLINTDFSKDLIDPNGNDASGTISVTISETVTGNYRATFTPNSVGIWYLVVYSTYFPWGKGDTIQVYNNDFDSLSDIIIRTLGLVQENHYIDNTIYDDDDNLTSCRIRLYDDSTKVGTASNVIATYLVTAGYTDNLLDYYKVVKQ